jgi:hypothetical protein
MTLKPASLGLALIVLFAPVGDPQAPQPTRDRDTPDFSVQVRGYPMADFSTRVWEYYELRSELQKTLPPLSVTEDPAESRRAARALAQEVRVARAKAKQGDIFTPTISVEFRRVLLLEMDADTWTAIMDDNPGELPTHINGDYPEGEPLSTVPPDILAVLPRLPDGIQYRFLGCHLILLDTRATVVLDRIPCAVRCTNRQNPTPVDDFEQGVEGVTEERDAIFQKPVGNLTKRNTRASECVDDLPGVGHAF